MRGTRAPARVATAVAMFNVYLYIQPSWFWVVEVLTLNVVIKPSDLQACGSWHVLVSCRFYLLEVRLHKSVCFCIACTWAELVCVRRLLPTGKLAGLFFTTEHATSGDGLRCCVELYHCTVGSTVLLTQCVVRTSRELVLCQWHTIEPCLDQTLQLLLWAYFRSGSCDAVGVPICGHYNGELFAYFVYLVDCAVLIWS